MISLNTNVSSLATQRRLGEATSALQTSYERLSSGLRIVRPADDAAGLAISSGLNVDSRVFTQGIRNINDSLSALSIAEGATTQLSTILMRLNELAEQSANGTLANTQRTALDGESRALISEFNRIVGTTSFNSVNLTNARNQTLTTQVGYDSLSVQISGAGISSPDGTFASVGTYSFGAANIKVADMNGDGVPDVIGSSTLTTSAFIALGNSNGSFFAPVSFQQSGSTGVLASGDVNGDGKQDLIAFDYNLPAIQVLLGNGDGTVKASVYYGPQSAFANFAVGDVNGDGRADISLNANSLGNSIMLANSDGSFLAPVIYQPWYFQQGSQTLLIDINNDGKIDSLNSTFLIGGLVVSLGNGDGNFKLPTYNPTAISGAGKIVAGDFNEDGKVDVISYNGPANVFLSNGDGTFLARNTYVTSSANVAVADVNGDGHLDLVNGTAGTLTVSFGNGDGSFQAYLTTAGTGGSQGVVSGDFDRNGTIDILGLNGGVISVLSGNQSPGSTLPVFSIATKANALIALGTVRLALQATDLNLSAIGASQSRLAYAASTLSITAQNYKQAQSLITDVDVATEAAQLSRLQIVQNASQAILAQANQAPALALQLLRV